MWSRTAIPRPERPLMVRSVKTLLYAANNSERSQTKAGFEINSLIVFTDPCMSLYPILSAQCIFISLIRYFICHTKFSKFLPYSSHIFFISPVISVYTDNLCFQICCIWIWPCTCYLCTATQFTIFGHLFNLTPHFSNIFYIDKYKLFATSGSVRWVFAFFPFCKKPINISYFRWFNI